MRGQQDCLTELCPNSSADVFLYIEEVLYLPTLPKMWLISCLSGITLGYYQERYWVSCDLTLCRRSELHNSHWLWERRVKPPWLCWGQIFTGMSLAVPRTCHIIDSGMFLCTNALKGQSHTKPHNSHLCAPGGLSPKFISSELNLAATHLSGDPEASLYQYFLQLKPLGIQMPAAKSGWS